MINGGGGEWWSDGVGAGSSVLVAFPSFGGRLATPFAPPHLSLCAALISFMASLTLAAGSMSVTRT